MSNFKKGYLVAICLLSLAGFLAGCGAEDAGYSSQISLEILGDVESPFGINSLAEAPATKEIEHRDKTIEVIPLGLLIEEASPYGSDYQILYIAHDGFSAQIANDNLNDCYLTVTEENGWEAINLNHPVSSNIKHIKEIVIVSNDTPVEQRFNIIAPGRNLASITIGQMYQKGYSITPSVRGTATVNHEGEELHATTYYRYRTINIEDYVSLANRSSVVVVGEKGEVEPLRQDGFFVLSKNSVDYMVGNEVIISRAKGLILDSPSVHITDVYKDILHAFNKETPILVILADGLGYHQYEHARDHGLIPYLETLPEPRMATSAYPSVTPVNMAASLSGELPYINGVYNRGIRQLDVPTIFGYGLEKGKSMAAVIGPLVTIEVEINPILSLDQNNDGSTDDEKTENALEIINQGHDLLFVHYKDIDRSGHTYGDMHQNTLEDISKIDAYIQQLVSNWQGKVLIYSDHGMYPTEDGGDHGALVTESMFTPYWLFDTKDLPLQ